MIEETGNPEEESQDDLQLRDRIVKIETIINYHDLEFRDIKISMSDLSAKVDRHQSNILAVLENNNKELKDAINANKIKFETFVATWSFGIKAVWIAILLTGSVMIWAFSASQHLGFVTVNPIVVEQIQE